MNRADCTFGVGWGEVRNMIFFMNLPPITKTVPYIQADCLISDIFRFGLQHQGSRGLMLLFCMQPRSIPPVCFSAQAGEFVTIDRGIHIRIILITETRLNIVSHRNKQCAILIKYIPLYGVIFAVDIGPGNGTLSHYLNQWWNVVNLILGNTFQYNCNHYTNMSFKKMHLFCLQYVDHFFKPRRVKTHV